MKTLNMEKLLDQYKIDVEYLEDFLDNDPVEVQEAFYKRQEILDNFDNIELKNLKKFLLIEKKLSKILPALKEKYPLLYEKLIESQNELLMNKLIEILVPT